MEHAGVVHQQVDLAERIERGVGKRCDRIAVGHVDRERDRRLTRGVRRLLRAHFVDVGRDDAHALSDETVDERTADAARGTRHDRDLAFELLDHPRPPRVCGFACRVQHATNGRCWSRELLVT